MLIHIYLQCKKHVEKILVFLIKLLNKVKIALFDKKRCHFIWFVSKFDISLYQQKGNKTNN